MATIRDVARLAGVGVGTVSRVLNNHPSVREQTRRRVLEAIEALNYHPDPSARRLSLRRTLTIGVIVPFITNPSVVERLRGITLGLEGTEYDLVIFNVETVQNRDRYFKEVVRGKRVDGLIVISLSPTDDEAERFAQADLPVVLVDAAHPRLPHVVIDDVQGGMMATQHLINLGHRRIAFLGDIHPNPFGFTASYHRYLGYMQALEKAELPYEEKYVVLGEHSRYTAYALAMGLFDQSPPPTAIFAASDTQALGVLAAAREAGYHVPEDLSVVGYDDVETAHYLGLTTIHQPLVDSGIEGISLLMKILAGEEVPNEIRLPLSLVVRQTTAPPRPGPKTIA